MRKIWEELQDSGLKAWYDEKTWDPYLQTWIPQRQKSQEELRKEALNYYLQYIK